MKYSEFKVEVEKLGLHLWVCESHIDVVDKHGDTVSCVAKYVEMGIDTEYEDFQKLPQEQRVAVFESLYKLAKTPLAEREEEKRYRLRKIPIPLLREASDRFYRKPLLSNYGPCTSSDITESFQYQIIFTESEIAQMDITGFEKIEVEE